MKPFTTLQWTGNALVIRIEVTFSFSRIFGLLLVALTIYDTLSKISFTIESELILDVEIYSETSVRFDSY